MATRVVITGASGNVGTALLAALAEKGGYDVTGVTRRRPPDSGIYRSATWHQVDLAERDAATALQPIVEGADCVVHLAWGFQPTRNITYLEALGVGGTRSVLTAADGAGVGHLLHMSSVGTYARGRYGEYVDESFSTAGIPSSAYSRHKAAAEALLDGYEEHNPDGVTITRMRPRFIVQRDAAGGLRRAGGPSPPRWPAAPVNRLPVWPRFSTWWPRGGCPSWRPTSSRRPDARRRCGSPT